MKLDDEFLALLADVHGVVEATSFEKHALWLINDKEVYGPGTKMTWVDNPSGRGINIGYFETDEEKLPILISLTTALINGKKILFYEPTSRLVDWDRVEDWLKANLPRSAFRPSGFLNRTDAMNFHNETR